MEPAGGHEGWARGGAGFFDQKARLVAKAKIGRSGNWACQCPPHSGENEPRGEQLPARSLVRLHARVHLVAFTFPFFLSSFLPSLLSFLLSFLFLPSSLTTNKAAHSRRPFLLVLSIFPRLSLKTVPPSFSNIAHNVRCLLQTSI